MNTTTETEIILEANSMTPRTKRKKLELDEHQMTLLESTREVYRIVNQGLKVLVVTEVLKSFEEVFKERYVVMELFKTLIEIKPISAVTAEDLEKLIVEM